MKIAKKLGFDYAEAVVCTTHLIGRAHTHEFISPFRRDLNLESEERCLSSKVSSSPPRTKT